MGNIRKERRKQTTFFKTLMIIAFGVALLATTLVIMVRGNTPKETNTANYTM